MRKLLGLLPVVFLFATGLARADAQVSEWIGTYTMNHDGFVGTLDIADSKRDCAGPPWCHLVLSYVDRDGAKRAGRIVTIDQAFQHMVFVIQFSGTARQRFDGYLMSWDKNKMAGVTEWGGRTFGFYAVKRTVGIVLRPLRVPEAAEQPSGGQPAEPTRTIRPDGTVELTFPDGTKRLTKPGVCGFTIVRPDGTTTTASCNQVQPATPPAVPDAATAGWLTTHSDSLLDIIRGLLGGDAQAVDNYLTNFEAGQPDLYERIQLRTSLISQLSAGS
jgi:hypothetical protein